VADDHLGDAVHAAGVHVPRPAAAAAAGTHAHHGPLHTRTRHDTRERVPSSPGRKKTWGAKARRRPGALALCTVALHCTPPATHRWQRQVLGSTSCAYTYHRSLRKDGPAVASFVALGVGWRWDAGTGHGWLEFVARHHHGARAGGCGWLLVWYVYVVATCPALLPLRRGIASCMFEIFGRQSR
jgi:hypothetical protein